MRVLVTGAAGFLGSLLCGRLLASEAAVVGRDTFITGSLGKAARLELGGTPGVSLEGGLERANAYLREALAPV